MRRAEEELLTIEQALEHVDMSRAELVDAITDRRLPAVRVQRPQGVWSGEWASTLRLRPADLERFAGSRWFGGQGSPEMRRLGFDVLSVCEREGCRRYAPGQHCPSHALAHSTRPEPLPRELTALEITAYHEAGHAHVARGLGGTVLEVSIVPDGARRWESDSLHTDGNGHCAARWRETGDAALDLRDSLTFALGGPIAADMARRRDWRTWPASQTLATEGKMDFQLAAADALSCSALDARAWVDDEADPAAERASEILERDWSGVAWTASELLKKRTIQGLR